MSSHRFKIGSVVLLNADGQVLHKESRYVVEAHLPPLGDKLQYRIKAEGEGFRRVAVEHQLSAPEKAHMTQPDRSDRLHPGEAD